MEKWETRSLQGHLNDRKEYGRVSRQIRGQALPHQEPLSPGPSLWSFHQHCVELTLNIWEIKGLSTFFFSASVEQGRESRSWHCSRGVNGRISWKGAAKPGRVKPYPGCPLICCYMEWKI